ncbi:MAG: hypothetical protein ACTSU2_12030 [Promethearchaeota archaeon]
MTAKFDSFYEFTILKDIFAHSQEYKDFFIRLMFGDKYIDHILKDPEKKRKFYQRFELLTHEQPFVFPEESGIEKLKNSEPKRRMDTGLLLDNIPVVVIEVETLLSRLKQIYQLRDYFILMVNLLHEFVDNKIANIKYFQYLRVISFSFQLSKKYKNTFEYTKGEALPLIIFEISKQWKKLPPESISYTAFKFIEDYQDIKDLKQLNILIERYLDKFDDLWQKFYFAGILKLYGGEYMDAVIREKEAAKELPTEEEVVKELSHEWVRFLTPEQIKHLDSQQIKYLDADQIKHLDADQIKHLDADQIKHLTTEQLASLGIDKILDLLLSLKESDRDKILKKLNELKNKNDK